MTCLGHVVFYVRDLQQSIFEFTMLTIRNQVSPVSPDTPAWNQRFPFGLAATGCLIDRAGIRIIRHIVVNIFQAGHVI